MLVNLKIARALKLELPPFVPVESREAAVKALHSLI
jgi:hypothetical protein